MNDVLESFESALKIVDRKRAVILAVYNEQRLMEKPKPIIEPQLENETSEDEASVEQPATVGSADGIATNANTTPDLQDESDDLTQHETDFMYDGASEDEILPEEVTIEANDAESAVSVVHGNNATEIDPLSIDHTIHELERTVDEFLQENNTPIEVHESQSVCPELVLHDEITGTETTVGENQSEGNSSPVNEREAGRNEIQQANITLAREHQIEQVQLDSVGNINLEADTNSKDQTNEAVNAIKVENAALIQPRNNPELDDLLMGNDMVDAEGEHDIDEEITFFEEEDGFPKPIQEYIGLMKRENDLISGNIPFDVSVSYFILFHKYQTK